MSDDPVSEIAPNVPTPATTSPTTQPTVSSPNSFFFYLLILTGFLLFHRLGWEAVKQLVGGRLGAQTLNLLFFLWMIPVMGILGSIIYPSMGTTTVWILSSIPAAGLPLMLLVGYTLLFGIRTSPSVATPSALAVPT